MSNTKKRSLLFFFLVIVCVSGVIVYSFMPSKNENFVSSKNDKTLTTEKKLEDFEYLFKFISENYPYLKVNERVNGINWLEEKEDFKSSIENTTTDSWYTNEINTIVKKLNNGHTHVVRKYEFPYYYANYVDNINDVYHNPWGDVLQEEKVLEWYEFDKDDIKKQKDTYVDKNSNISYCKTDIIVPNEVAYLKIQKMSYDSFEKDGIKIRSFFKEIKDYNKLIIDIRGNVGGDDIYWMKNVVEPLLNNEITTKNYTFLRGDYGIPFYDFRGSKFSLISDLDKNALNNIPVEVIKDFKYYYILTKRVEPIDSVGFNGKIYLLVDDKVYSSSESFAAFSKQSGFATLVGSTTGGDGIGFDPLLFSLPNSGIVIRFSGTLTLNGDGSINEEVHTRPNIEINPAIGNTYEIDKAIQYVIEDKL